MYFVRFGDVCVRYVGKKRDKDDLPEDTFVIDYKSVLAAVREAWPILEMDIRERQVGK